jgi:hypothetical protein
MAREKQSSADKTKSASLADAGRQDDAHKGKTIDNGNEAATKGPTTKKEDGKKNEAPSQKDSPATPGAAPEFNSEVATIAAILMSDRVREIRMLGTIPRELSDPSWDLEFDGALKRAELLIRKLTSRDFDVHLYQVFPEGQKFTEEQISDELTRVKWRDLTSKAPISTLMADLKKLFEKDLRPIPHSEYSEAAQRALKTIRETLSDLWDDCDDIRTFFPRFPNEITGLLERLVSDLGAYGTEFELFSELDDQHRFFNWCFPFEMRGEIKIRRYRPHEIFRFAAMRGWLPEKLVLTLSDLAPGFVPYPPKNLHIRDFKSFEKSGKSGSED